MKVQFKLYIALVLGQLSGSCLSSQDTGVERVAADEVYDLTGKWNDIDSQKIALQMVDKILEAGWLSRWDNSSIPVIIVGNVNNNTAEQIDTRIFVKDLEAELINSGKVAFVASLSERSQVRDERYDQQSNASDASMKRIAQEAGADFMLIGSIDATVEESSSTKVVYYLVSMELINVESNIKAWIGTERIKKRINKAAQSRNETTARQNKDW